MTVVIAVATTDVLTIGAEHRADALLKTTRQSVHIAHVAQAATRAATVATWKLWSERQEAQAATVADIASTGQSLDATVRAVQLRQLDIATLRSCLSGVSSAESAVSSSNTEGAVLALTGASSSCRSVDGTTNGPAYAFDFPDPFVMTVGSEYYAFATNSVAGNIQEIRSSDLASWTTVGDALPTAASWAGSGATWGPSVLERSGTFVLYYSTLFGTSGDQCISEAVASQPQGPYVDSSTSPMVCQLGLGGSIDPSPVVAPDGTPFLTWKSEGAAGQAATLWSQQLTPDGTSLVPGSPSPLLTATQPWQGGVVEGPDMVVAGGQYDLFYSANNWQTADYAIGVAGCAGPLGPCTPIGDGPLLASGSAYLGPGGPSVFTDLHGTTWLAFHAWLPGEVGFPNSRDLFLRRLTLSAAGPQLSS